MHIESLDNMGTVKGRIWIKGGLAFRNDRLKPLGRILLTDELQKMRWVQGIGLIF